MLQLILEQIFAGKQKDFKIYTSTQNENHTHRPFSDRFIDLRGVLGFHRTS